MHYLGKQLSIQEFPWVGLNAAVVCLNLSNPIARIAPGIAQVIDAPRGQHNHQGSRARTGDTRWLTGACAMMTTSGSAPAGACTVRVNCMAAKASPTPSS